MSYMIFYSLLLSMVGWKLKVTPFCIEDLKVAAVILLMFSANMLWLGYLSPLFILRSGGGFVPLFIDAFLRTGIIFIAGFAAMIRMEVSPEINGIVFRLLPFLKKSGQDFDGQL